MFHFEIDRLKKARVEKKNTSQFALFFTASGTSRRVEMKFDDGIMLHIRSALKHTALEKCFIADFSHCREIKRTLINALHQQKTQEKM
jgi:hypothetical protein